MLKSLKIGTRLSFSFGIVFALFCLLAFFAISQISFMGDKTAKIYEHPLTVSNAVRRVNTNIIKIHRTMKDVVLSKTIVEINTDRSLVDKLERMIYDDFSIIERQYLGDMATYQNAYELFKAWKEIRDEVILLMLTEKRDEAVDITRNRGAMHVVQIELAMEELSTFAANKAIEFRTDAELAKEDSLQTMYMILAFVAIAILILTYYLTQSISRPVRALEAATREIGLGKFDTHLEIEGSGELGELAISIKDMASNLNLVTASRDELDKEIRERKEAEKDRLLLSSSVEQSKEAITITDTEGKIQYVNPAFVNLTGYDIGDVLGKNPRILNSGSQSAQYYKEMWQVIKSGAIWQGRIVDRRKDSSFYPAMLTISPIKDSDGEITNFVGIQQDLSEIEALEEQFRQAQKMEAIGNLVGGIAHDFNNTLAGITGNLFLAKDEVSHMPKAIDRIKTVESLAFRAAGMIQQLLTFARKGVVSMNPITISSFLKETIKIQQVSIPEDIELSYTIENSDVQIKGDINQLQQIIMNLLNNARDAVQDVESPHIHLSLGRYSADKHFMLAHPNRKTDNYVLLTVVDNGHGINEQDIEHIFEPYYTTKSVGEGTGLGLAMVHGAVTSHDGIVTVSSEPGKTEFKIYFPELTDAQRVVAYKDDKELVKGQDETILLVDDEVSVLETGTDVLQKLNYNVKTARDGIEALTVYQDGADIDLVVLDVVMPKLGGPDTAQKLRLINPDVKIIFATGYEFTGNGYQRSRLGKEVLITKPFAISDFSNLIREQLDREPKAEPTVSASKETDIESV